MRTEMWMWILWAVAAGGVCAQERIADVRSLEDLRGLKGVAVKEWEIRVGLGEGGSEAGPWKLIYCLAKHVGQEEKPVIPFMRDADEPLGPVKLDIAWDKRRMMDSIRRGMSAIEVERGAEVLFCAAVVLDREGVCHISVRGPDDALLLAREVEVKERRPCLWHSFAALDRYADVAGEMRFRYRVLGLTMAHRPEYGGMRGVALNKAPRIDPGLYPAAASLLPGAIPLCDEWRRMMFSSVKLGADEPALELALQDGRISVRSKMGKMIDWADEYVLARWWVNGRSIAAPPGKRLMRMAGRAVGETEQMAIIFGLPQTLGKVRVGDKVALQVLYCPDGTAPITDDWGLSQCQAAGRLGVISVPLLSNRIEFAVTEGM